MSLLDLVWLGSYGVALLTAPSVLMQRRGRPSSAVGWLLALLALPPVALLAWWLVGRTHLERRRRRRRQASHRIEQALGPRQQRISKPGGKDVDGGSLVARVPAALSDSMFPPTRGNEVHLLRDTLHVHRCWQQLIEQAEHHLHVLFFAWHDDNTGRTFRDLLTEKAKRGCEVRVLGDAMGTHELPATFFDPLREAGAEVAMFMPLRLLTATPRINFRNHRKLVIADGRAAYTGGVNVTDEYLEWLDIGIAVFGPSVRQLQEVFIDDWHFTTSQELTDERYHPDFPAPPTGALSAGFGDAVCETVASGPDQIYNASREMAFLAITRCRERLWIATPYFVPDSAILLALRTAVYRGIDVRLYVPGRNDSPMVRRASRAFYPELLDGEIAIFEYDGMLHAKAMLVDDDFTIIGSANMDTRSFRLNFELGMLVTSKLLNAELAELFAGIESRSRRVQREEVEQRSYFGQLRDAVAHLLSPLL